MSALRSPKDFWAGLLYMGIGGGAWLIAGDYDFGSATKMGPGYFPSVLGGLIVLVGLISLVRGFITPGEPIRNFALKPLAIITLATLAFALLVRTAGFIIALPVLIIIASMARAAFTWRSVLTIAAAITVFSYLIFIYGLGVPMPLLGSWFN